MNRMTTVNPTAENDMNWWSVIARCVRGRITAVLAMAGFMLMPALSARAGAGTIENDFVSPPMSARPYVFWHWMGADFSKAGIT
jgi:hypothetical protein